MLMQFKAVIWPDDLQMLFLQAMIWQDVFVGVEDMRVRAYQNSSRN